MIPLSCSNCCFNGLQYGSLGLTVGYCVEHKVVLRRADETTCGRHLRKDLGRDSRDLAQQHHAKAYSADYVQFVRTLEPAGNGAAAIETNTELLEKDPVGEAATDYGFLGSKIASLAQLRALPGIRAELAMLSLGRSYVRRCVLLGGAWTSGLHLFWWTRRRIGVRPNVDVTDFRLQTAASIERQAELAAWSIVMLRLNFLSDVGLSAPANEPVSQVADIVERAAEATEIPDLDSLMRWIRTDGDSRLETALPYESYNAKRALLHKDTDNEVGNPEPH